MSPLKVILSTIVNTITFSKSIISNKIVQLKEKVLKYFISMKFISQLIIYYFFIIILIGLIVIHVRLSVYPIIVTASYNKGYQMKFSNGIIRKAIANVIHSANLEADSRSESELSQMLLMKIYFKELIEHNLLGGKSFSNATNYSDYYSSLNSIYEANFTIDKTALEEMIDNRSSFSLGELIKVAFIFTPLIIQEAKINNNHLFSVFLLPYYFDKNTLKYHSKAYFQYPASRFLYTLKQNFVQINKLTDPLIDDSINQFDPSFTNVPDQEYKTANWFVLRDFYFRMKSKASFGVKPLSNIMVFNHAKIKSDMINRFHYEVLQFIPNKGSPLVINLIFKYEEKNSPDIIEHFSFLMQNVTFDPSNDDLVKYSDNSSFVITKNAIAPLTLSDKYLNFFNFVFKRKNYLYTSNGQNFDTFDLERFNTIDDYYNIPTEKYSDVLLLKTMQIMYTVMIKQINFNHESTSPTDNYYLYNFTDQEGIKSICDSINILKHFQNLKDINFETKCLSNSQVFFYLQSHGLQYDTIEEDALPDCACLPFYCLNITTSNINKGQIEYTKILHLPNSCESTMNTYYSPWIIEAKAKKNTIQENIFKKNRMFFKYKKIPYLKGSDILNVHNYFDFHLLKAEAYLRLEINKVIQTFSVMNFAVFALIFVVFSILLIYTAIRKNNIIFMFISRQEEYLNHRKFEFIRKKGTMNIMKEITPYSNGYLANNDLHNNSSNIQARDSIEQDLNESNEGITLISNIEVTNDKEKNDYNLIDDLFDMYCNFYQLKRDKLIKKLEEKREKEKNKDISLVKLKRNFLQNKNELFELLAWFAYSLPKYQMSIKCNVNLYKTNPLVKKYIMTKRKTMRTIPSISLKPSKETFGLSQALLCELLSTEAIFDKGIIVNLRYNYKNYLQPNIYNYLSSLKKKKLMQTTEFKLKEKKRDDLYKELESEIKINDVFKLDEMKSTFNYYLTEIFYPVIRNIYIDLSFEQNRKCFLKK